MAVSSRSGTADLSLAASKAHTEIVMRPRKPRSAGRRAFSFLIFCIVLGSLAFGGTYLYSNPQLQTRLGIKAMVDQLPWKHEEVLARAREHPLEFEQMTLALSSRDGTALGPPQAAFTDTDLTNARYLKWTANFKYSLAGLEGRSEKIDARFFDPSGLQIASSSSDLFVGPSQKTAEFAGVALMPSMSDKPAGQYRVALYLDNVVLGENAFSVTQDVSARKKADAEAAAAAATVKAEEQRRKEEARRLAMIDERRMKPLEFRAVQFINTTKTGTPISAPSNSFDASKVLFVGWQITFDNRLYGLEAGQYRVDATYIGPTGNTLGSVNDWQNVNSAERNATFSGRVGNSRGGAFIPGTYSVNFYLNGQYVTQKKFRVVADATGPGTYSGSSSGGGGSGYSGSSGGSTPADFLGPTLATGRINGLPGGSSELELRLRPQPNGFLHGELVIHQSGFGLTPIEGFIRGSHLQFQVPYGSETYYFEGQRRSDTMSGTFESTPSGGHGTWTAQAN